MKNGLDFIHYESSLIDNLRKTVGVFIHLL